MSSLEDVKDTLDSVLSLRGRARGFSRETPLLGSIPELDSMAVVSVITAIEERFAVVIDDDELSAETFETVGALADFVDRKLEA